MKRFISLTLIGLLSMYMLSGQTSKIMKDPVGKWLFEAPYAPEGYRAGIIEVGNADKIFSAYMAFSGIENKFPGDMVKFENDTLRFNVNIEGNYVAVTLSFVDETKMTGKAVYTEGVVPLSLIREMKKE